MIVAGKPHITSSNCEITKGILSHTERTFYISDAQMEKGFSGGPVVSINRTLIGIVKGTTNEDLKMLEFIPSLIIDSRLILLES